MSRTDVNKLPENFTLSLALVDALPVLLFGGSCILLSRHFDSALFLAGAVLCLLAGSGKVLWKILIATVKRNYILLSRQLRVLMPTGFGLMVAALVVNRSQLSGGAILSGFLSVPSVFFFCAGILGMMAMSVFAVKLDGNDVRSNWIEQITNAAAQGCFFIGILLL